MGSEGQLLPRDSALHSPPAARGRPQALPRKGAPGWRLGVGSSRCSRLDHSGPARHLPRDWIAEVTALLPLEPPGTFVPVDASLKFSGSSGIPVLGGSVSARFLCDPRPTKQELLKNYSY